MTKADFQKLLDAVPDNGVVFYKCREDNGFGGLMEPVIVVERMCELRDVSAGRTYFEAKQYTELKQQHLKQQHNEILREFDSYVLDGNWDYAY